ncbi:MAG TPA: biotin--[acetyl-CoA-carboxylase] ligase [Hanamia sp.]|nr:biotin--[acetyl-CoA-carboxylase] ligase [Hanamia sp.]
MSFSPENILVLDSIDSTNNYAMALIQRGDATAIKPVFALEQIYGKGRRGKHWKSNKGANIILSIPLQMQWLSVSQQFHLSVAIALSCHDLFYKYNLANLFIKWPNDIFINDSKAGGILIENVIKGTLWQWSVIGIGINVNQEGFEEFDLKATSLKLATGKSYDVLNLAEELLCFVLKRIEELKSGNFEKMLEEYNRHLFAKNKTVKLKKENIVFETTITGVSSSGQLITKDAFERRFDFDEVEFKGLV